MSKYTRHMDSGHTLTPFSANLNTSYFTDRQDRYLHFSSQPNLAQYCFGFLQASSGFSYSLEPASKAGNDYALRWHDGQTHPHHLEAKAARTLSTFQQTSRLGSAACLGPLEKVLDSADSDTLIFPIIQAGQFGIREEERALGLLFSHLTAQQPHSRLLAGNNQHYDGPLMDLTSGYFGLYKDYRDLVLQGDLRCRIIAASPKVRKGGCAPVVTHNELPAGQRLLRIQGHIWTHSRRLHTVGTEIYEGRPQCATRMETRRARLGDSARTGGAAERVGARGLDIPRKG